MVKTRVVFTILPPASSVCISAYQGNSFFVLPIPPLARLFPPPVGCLGSQDIGRPVKRVWPQIQAPTWQFCPYSFFPPTNTNLHLFIGVQFPYYPKFFPDRRYTQIIVWVRQVIGGYLVPLTLWANLHRRSQCVANGAGFHFQLSDHSANTSHHVFPLLEIAPFIEQAIIKTARPTHSGLSLTALSPLRSMIKVNKLIENPTGKRNFGSGRQTTYLLADKNVFICH